MKKTPTDSRPRFRRRLIAGAGTILLGCCLLGSSFFKSAPQTRDQAAAESGFEIKPVFEAPFSHTLPSDGLIESRDQLTLASQVSSRTAVLELIPAGTFVRAPVVSQVSGSVVAIEFPTAGEAVVVVEDDNERTFEHRCDELGEYTEVVVQEGDSVRKGESLIGDVVARLDPASLLDLEIKFEIAYTRAKANFEVAKNNYIVRQINNESKNSAARLAADLAQLDLRKYLEGAYPQEKEKLEGNIQQLREDFTRDNETLAYKERMQAKGYQTVSDVEAAQLKLLVTQIKLNDAQKQLEVLNEFDFNRTRLDLERKAENAVNNMKRIQLAGEAALAQDRSNRASRHRVYEIYLARLRNVRDQIKSCTLVAPRAGQVVHASTGRSRRSNSYVEVGSQVYERQPIVHIPDMSSMKVDARIHESLISRIGLGMPVEIRVDAVADQIYQGKLTKLSSVPMPGEYPNYDRKEYRAEIEIVNDELAGQVLRPGMSAKLELMVHRGTESFVQIPIQAVMKLREQRFAWVYSESGPELRSLELGRDNDEAYIVRAGVLPGEQVVLQPWKHFTSQIAELQARYGTDEPAPDPFTEEPEFYDEPELPLALMLGLEEVEEPESKPSERTQTARVDTIGEE